MENRIQVYSGNYIDLEDPDADNLEIEDIAHSLSLLCRFTGHIKEFYSVAQHSVLAAWVGENYYNHDVAKAALLHDAHEAYLGDVASPLKRIICEKYSDLVHRFDKALFYKFNFPPYPEEIAEIDRNLELTEAEQLLGADLNDGFWPSGDTYDIEIVPWSPEEAEKVFYQVYLSLLMDS